MLLYFKSKTEFYNYWKINKNHKIITYCTGSKTHYNFKWNISKGGAVQFKIKADVEIPLKDEKMDSRWG